MEEENMQGHPTRIPVQGLFLLLIPFHTMVFSPNHSFDWGIYKYSCVVNNTGSVYYYIMEAVLVITHCLNIQWKITFSVDKIWIMFTWLCYLNMGFILFRCVNFDPNPKQFISRKCERYPQQSWNFLGLMTNL